MGEAMTDEKDDKQMVVLGAVNTAGPIRVHLHALPHPELRAALHAFLDQRKGRTPAKEEWVAHCAEFYDWYTSLRG
jgi:cation transport ATPase